MQLVDKAFHLGHGPLPAQTEVLGALNETVGPDATIVQAAGSMPGDLQMLWRAEDPKQYHVEYAFSCMGYEIAGALGIKMAAPEREVYSLVGDGSYLMMAQEIVTAVSENIKLIVILVQNHGFASIGALSESLGSQRFGTNYRFRDDETGQLDGDILPVDLATQRPVAGRRRHPGQRDRRVPQGPGRGPGRHPHHGHPHRHRPAGTRAVLRILVGRPRVPGVRNRTARSGLSRPISSTRPPNGRSSPPASSARRSSHELTYLRPFEAGRRNGPRFLGGLVRQGRPPGRLEAIPGRGRPRRVRVDRAGTPGVPARRTRHNCATNWTPAVCKVSGGTVFAGLHKGRDALDEAITAFSQEAKLLAEVGAKYLVHLPEQYTDMHTGAATASGDLDREQWKNLVTGTNELGKVIFEEHGVQLVFHPHADTHVDTQDRILQFLADTDPRYVNLCLDTGHVAYCDGDNIEIIRQAPERITYVHLKFVDPTVRQRVRDEKLSLAEAVPLGVMVEPPYGEPAVPPLLDALTALDREVFTILEQDLYPIAPTLPLGIQARAAGYLTGCGLGPIRRWPYQI